MYLFQNYLLNNAKPASLHYNSMMWSDQKPEDLVVQVARAKFLDFLPQEIPYNLKIELEYYEELEEENRIVCSIKVECPSERLIRLIAGAGGGRLQQIKSHLRHDLCDLFKKQTTVEISMTTNNKSKDL